MLPAVLDASLDAFWVPPRLAVLGTVRADGSPHLVPVKTMRLGGGADGAARFAVLTRPETVKVRNLRHRAWASLAEHTDTVWATVEGPAHVDDDPALLAAARAAYEVRFGRPDTWGTCVLVVSVERVLTGT